MSSQVDMTADAEPSSGGLRTVEDRIELDATPTVVIGATRSLSINPRELWAYRELLYFLAWRDLKVRYKQTSLGIAWAVLQPFATMVIFTVIFGHLAKIPSQGLPYPVFVFSGLLAWNYFSQSLSLGSLSLLSNANLVTKVYAPRLLLPLAVTAVPLVDAGLALGILAGLMAWYGIAPGLSLVALPIFVLFAFLTAMGVSLLVSALTVRFRDARFMLPFVLQFWMYASPVIYPSTLVSERYRWILSLNPMTGTIDGFRWALVGSPVPSVFMFAASAVCSVAIAILGLAYFRRVERNFADII